MAELIKQNLMRSYLFHPSFLLLILMVFGCAPARYEVPSSQPMRFRTPEFVEEDEIEEEIVIDRDVVILPSPTPPKRDKSPLIVIDPGHGGKDLGTHSFKTPKYQEKTLNLATAKLVRHYLQQLGYSTMLTRKEDVFISLEQRSVFANKMQPQLFVSVHYNSAPSNTAEGIEVFYFSSDQNHNRTAESKLLAQTVLNSVIQKTHAKSRGIKHGNLAVIRETTMPAILIEGGFLTNPKEQEKLRDKEYLKKIAWGIAKGIDDFLKS